MLCFTYNLLIFKVRKLHAHNSARHMWSKPTRYMLMQMQDNCQHGFGDSRSCPKMNLYYILSPGHIPYARHHNPLLIRKRSRILTIHKDRIFPKKLLEKKEMDLKNGAINIKPRVIMARIRYRFSKWQLVYYKNRVSVSGIKTKIKCWNGGHNSFCLKPKLSFIFSSLSFEKLFSAKISNNVKILLSNFLHKYNLILP